MMIKESLAAILPACVVAALCLGAVLAGPAAGGENWTSYRGLTDQGICDSADLPIQWSETENVVWRTPIAGKAWSSPVVWENRIWLTNANEEGTQLDALCIDKTTGKVLFRKKLHFVAGPQYCIPFNSYASPSPVIEEGRVYVSFGSPYTGCLDSTTGEEIWKRTDFVCNHFRGAGSSPFLYKDLLILHFDGSDKQYIVAMDKHTGKTVWKTDRSVDFHDLDPETGGPSREGDYRKAFSTPRIVDAGGRPVLVSLGSMALYGYDPETGEELWRVESIGNHSGSSRPVIAGGLVYSSLGFGSGFCAIRPDGRGVVNDTHVLWEYKGAVPKRSSAVLVDDLLYMVDDNGVAACVDAGTGEEVWKARLGGNFSASPVVAGGRIYFCDETGATTVIEAGREFQKIAVNKLDEGFMASPAASGDALFLRSKTSLYRIENR
jgi:outer membrane protein assembly factor BamB